MDIGTMTGEPITEYLRRSLRSAGASRFDAIAAETGVAGSFIRKFVYGSRENPRVQTIQPLLDLFQAVDRGERALPDPLPAAAEQQPAAAAQGA
jgi:hypothetical protein